MATTSIALADLRHHAVARSLFAPTSLARALETLGFVQADPIRAPARAQDLTLRHRVEHYRAGDLERRYALLDIEEDVFVNYGFVTRAVQALMHPRAGVPFWSPARRRQVQALLAFIGERDAVHPRDVDDHFSHGTVTNYWGGSSNATTHLLDGMHYRGLLRVVRRQNGIRLYARQQHGARPAGVAARRRQIDALVDVVVNKYAPLPGASLSMVISRLRYAAPQWRGELREALRRARERLSHAHVDGTDWYWPTGEPLLRDGPDDTVRLLAPFDPVAWDRRRFEIFWGWAYRFEAYTPVARRKRGYYALPLLWRDQVIGWGNATAKEGGLDVSVGYVAGQPPRARAFRRELDAEIERLRAFLVAAPVEPT